MNNPVSVLLVTGEESEFYRLQSLLAMAPGDAIGLKRISRPADDEAPELAGCDLCLYSGNPGSEDGLKAFREFGARAPACPIVVLLPTPDYEPDYESDMAAMAAGAADCLILSELTPGQLERSIRYALHRSRSASAVPQRPPADIPFAAAIDNLSVSVLITDPRRKDNPLVFVNPAFTAITGYTPEEVLGRNARLLAHADSDPQILKDIHEAITDRRTYKGTLVNRRKDGTLYHYALVISPVFDDQGELTNFIGIGEDVSAQYKALESLRRSEQRYEGMVANIPGMVFRSVRYAAGPFQFTYVSQGCFDLFGIAPEEFESNTWTLRQMIHPDDRQSWTAEADALLIDPKPWRWEGRFIIPTGQEKVIQCFGNPETQSNGDVIWNGLLLDVTERAQAERQAALLAAIVNNSCDAIKSKTLDGIVTSWNAAAEKMYGYTAEEMIGKPIARLLPPDRPKEIETILKRIATGESVQSYETARLTKDGRLIDIALTVSPVRDTGGHIVGAASIAQDIGARKRAEAMIQRQILRIQALRDIDMAIASSLDLRVTLNVLLDQVTTHLRTDSAAVLLLNAHTHRLEYAAGRGFRTSEIDRTYLRLGEGYAGQCALERRVVNIPDLLDPQCAFQRDRLIVEEGFVTYWAAPLVAKGRVEGVLEIYNRTPLPADADWRNFLEVLAGQAAIAIENAALFNDLQRSNVDLQIAYDTTLEGWSKALDLRDRETEGHTLRVTEGLIRLARAMNVPDAEAVHMRRGALLHDIGKMGVPDAILLKAGPLTEEEWVVMKRHPTYAYELLSPIQFLRPALDIPYCHHEKWDGSGYPRGLKGEQIPLSARMFAIVDVWDALRSHRPYRPAWPTEKVCEHIRAGRGTHFDPDMVDLFEKVGL